MLPSNLSLDCVKLLRLFSDGLLLSSLWIMTDRYFCNLQPCSGDYCQCKMV